MVPVAPAVTVREVTAGVDSLLLPWKTRLYCPSQRRLILAGALPVLLACVLETGVAQGKVLVSPFYGAAALKVNNKSK